MTLANNQPKTISTRRVRDCLRITKGVSFPGSHGKVVSASGMFVRRIDVLHRLALTLTLAVGWKYFVVLLIIAKQSIDIDRGMGGFYGRIQYVSTSCFRYGAPIQQLTSGCSIVLFRIKRFCRTKHFETFVWFRTKRFLSTKHVVEFIWFHLKRFRGTKLHEDCPLWPAAYEVERIAPAWRTSPHGPTGRRTWDPSFPYHMFEVYGSPRHGQTHETTQNKKSGKVFCKTLPL